MKCLSRIILLLAVIFTGCKEASKAETDDNKAVAEPYKLQQTLYHGGDIITMAGDTPNYVEAVVQREGQIIFTGTKVDALAKYKGKEDYVSL